MAALLAVLTASVVYAYEVGPLRIVLTPSKGEVGGTFRINNTRDETLPVEIKVLRRSVARDGSQTFEPADDDFSVFPIQVQVAAKQSQAIRFKYLGSRQIETSAAYVLQVTEVPVTKPGFTGVRFTYNFGVAVYLDPANAVEKLKVENVSRAGDDVILVVSNSGNKFATIINQELALTSGGTKLRLTAAELKDKISNPLIPPNSSREFKLPLGQSLPPGPLTATIASGT